MKFEYLPQLNIIIVSTVNSNDKNLLVNLYPNDTGLYIPNPMSRYKHESKLFDETVTGRPYKWAQWLGGLDFIQEDRSTQNNEVKAHPLGSVISQIRLRLKSTQALNSQFESLCK